MRVAVVAGPDPGHSFPAIALCQRFRAAADTPTLFTGVEWLEAARAAGIDAVELDGLAATDRDLDAGARIHRRAAQMAVLNVPRLRALEPELVVSDVITACGGMAAELLGIPWVELNPHPLYLPSKGLPPINVPRLRALEPELVVSDVITACGGMAAELLGIPLGDPILWRHGLEPGDHVG